MIDAMLDGLILYLHYFAIFGLAGALIIENMALKPSISGEDARNLAKVDAVCGGSAVAVFLFGLTLWLWVGKPSEFYAANPLFQIKLGLFVLIILLAIYPALFFNKNRHSTEESVAVPGLVRLLLKLELIILLIIPVLASLMARGVGLNA